MDKSPAYPYKIIDKLEIKKTEQYEIDINFDDAHLEWTKNKIKGKNGTYKYKNVYNKRNRKKPERFY